MALQWSQPSIQRPTYWHEISFCSGAGIFIHENSRAVKLSLSDHQSIHQNFQLNVLRLLNVRPQSHPRLSFHQNISNKKMEIRGSYVISVLYLLLYRRLLYLLYLSGFLFCKAWWACPFYVYIIKTPACIENDVGKRNELTDISVTFYSWVGQIKKRRRALTNTTRIRLGKRRRRIPLYRQ